MGKYPNKATEQQNQPEQSLLSQFTLHFEYNKTISQARGEIRTKNR